MSVPEWEAATKSLYDEAEQAIKDSALLRSIVDEYVLRKSAKKLRDQADVVDVALSRFISDTQQVEQAVENDLRQVREFVKYNYFSKNVFIVMYKHIKTYNLSLSDLFLVYT